MLWDEGTWEPKGDPHAGLKKGHLAFELHGERLKGGWDLIRMRGDEKRENWLLIKEADRGGRSNGPNGAFLDGLASSVTTGRSMEEIAAGETAQAHAKQAQSATESRDAAALKRSRWTQYPDVSLRRWSMRRRKARSGSTRSSSTATGCSVLSSAARSRLRTRNGNRLDGSFPSGRRGLAGLKTKDAVLDMEAVVLDRKGKSSFQALQAALGEGGQPERIVAYAFDLLHLDGKDLTRLPLTERKDKLADAARRNPNQDRSLPLQRAFCRRWRGDARQGLRARDWRASFRNAPTRPMSRAGERTG